MNCNECCSGLNGFISAHCQDVPKWASAFFAKVWQVVQDPLGAIQACYSCSCEEFFAKRAVTVEDSRSVPVLESVPVLDPASKKVNSLVDRFPKELVEAFGRSYLETLPEVHGVKRFSFDLIPDQAGGVKGTDETGRLFVAFVVKSPRAREVRSDYKWGDTEKGYPLSETIITVIQKTPTHAVALGKILCSESDAEKRGGPSGLQRDADAFRFQEYYDGALDRFAHCTHLATGDQRLLTRQDLAPAQYAALKEIFARKHRDLQRVARVDQSMEAKLARAREQIDGRATLRPGLKGREEVALSAYQRQLQSKS